MPKPADRAREIADDIVHLETDGAAWSVMIWEHTVATYMHRRQADSRRVRVADQLADALRAYAAEAVAAEREACATVADEWNEIDANPEAIAAAIRARGGA